MERKVERKEFFDKIYGCWLGKSIGGTIGCSMEGTKEFLNLPLEFPDKMLPNDDFDLQLVWLDILKKEGIKITSDNLAEGWLNNIIYPFDEYAVAIANLKMGLKPPVSGYYNNWFKNSMGSSIRSEIWACISPGKPEIAGWYAYQDASVDHWDEGVYGEIFLACLESAAFSCHLSGNPEILTLINAGLSFLPEFSKVRKVVEFSLKSFKEGKSLREARDKILEKFGHYNFTDCLQNIGFIILGLLYGNGDFLKTIVSSINCGYDTDCTGGTSGAIIGILLGKENILKNSNLKINDKIAVGWGIKDIKTPQTLTELTGETINIGEKVLEEKNLPSISKPFFLPSISDFTPPFKIPFLISSSFSLNDIEETEKRILNGNEDNFEIKVIFDNFYFDLNKYFGNKLPEVIFLSTNFKVTKKRKLKIFPASTDGIKMWIDKKPVLSHHKHNGFLPVPHRPGSPLVELKLEKGWHRILLEVMRCKKDFEFGWIVADEKNYLITDLNYEI